MRKAFDRVFRAGLWYEIYKQGIQGKMWRVLRKLYDKVESCVRIDGETSEWFSLETGVKQGCILSPLLYALFINGLIKKLKKSKMGIRINTHNTLEVLFYADDIVLMTENKEKLQHMMNIIHKYAHKWRFEINPSKSGIIVFKKRDPPRNLKITLGECEIKTTNVYKYLGIELTRTLRWKPYTQRILEKAKRNMYKTWSMGVSKGFLNIKISVLIYQALVRSILEYGCEIWGEGCFLDFERLQRNMGRKILRCGLRTNEEVIRGELGWETLRARETK